MVDPDPPVDQRGQSGRSPILTAGVASGRDLGDAEGQAHCIVCGSTGPVRRLFVLDRPIVQCDTCGLVLDQPTSHDEGSAYTESYYRGTVYVDYLAERPVIRKNAQVSLAEIEARTPGRSLLDVGCAAGFFLEAARDRGWTVCGVEVSDYAAKHALTLGLDVHIGSIVSPPEGLPRFDVVTLWDTIEHLGRPDLALANINRLLKPGGLLVVSTGDYDSLVRRLTGRRWRLFGDRTHRFFFTGKTLSKLLTNAGFDVQKIHRRGKTVGLPMILHQSPLPFGGALGRWLDRRGWHPSIPVNLWDVMTVFATANAKPR